MGAFFCCGNPGFCDYDMFSFWRVLLILLGQQIEIKERHVARFKGREESKRLNDVLIVSLP